MVFHSWWKEWPERCLTNFSLYPSLSTLFSCIAATLQPCSYLTMNISLLCVSVCEIEELCFAKILSASPSFLLSELTLTSIEEFFHSVLSCIRLVIHALFFVYKTLNKNAHAGTGFMWKWKCGKETWDRKELNMFPDNLLNENGSNQLLLLNQVSPDIKEESWDCKCNLYTTSTGENCPAGMMLSQWRGDWM